MAAAVATNDVPPALAPAPAAVAEPVVTRVNEHREDDGGDGE